MVNPDKRLTSINLPSAGPGVSWFHAVEGENMMTADAAQKTPSGKDYEFTVSRAEGAEYETDGLREEFVYRDLGVADASAGLQVIA